jgi:branched-chain amino acid transport system ATP-binding protein
MTRLEVEELHAGYGGALVLRGVSFSVGDGEAAAIFGWNGSGKSTVLRAVNGLIPRAGRVTFGGIELARLPAEAIASIGVAHVPQGKGNFVRFTVEENLRVGAAMLDRAGAAAELERIYALLPQLAERRRQKAGTLSGGEQQMLAIGRAIMARPRLMLLDEPSAGLAPQMVGRIYEILTTLRRERDCSFVLVEQDPKLASGFAETAHLLEGGRIVLSCRPGDQRLADRLSQPPSFAGSPMAP